jgi:hypothetical protein
MNQARSFIKREMTQKTFHVSNLIRKEIKND